MQTQETVPFNDVALLNKAIGEAELLLAHAAEHGLGISTEVITTIVNSKELLRLDQPAADSYRMQIAFWEARDKLARAVSPRSVSSLIFATMPMPRPSSFLGRLKNWILGLGSTAATAAELALHRVQLIIFLGLSTLIVTQAYFVVGSNVLSEITPVLQKSSELYLSRAKIPTVAEKISLAENEKLQDIDAQLATAETELNARVEVLVAWNKVWRVAAFWFISSPEKEISDPYQHSQVQILSAKFALQTLHRFILPLMYGMLGASLFVLRSLSQDIRDFTFDRDRIALYRMRIYLGTLAGFVASCLMPNAEDVASLKSFGPYVLSLLAGYSVDLVFSAMDKLLATFSSVAESKSPKAKPPDNIN